MISTSRLTYMSTGMLARPSSGSILWRWLLAYNLGYPPRELRRIESIISEHQQELMGAWNEYFGA
jgi:Domain of unknown function (DUF4160)